MTCRSPCFPPPFASDNLASARRVRSSRPASAGSFSALGLNLVLTHGIPPAFRDSVHLSYTVNRHRVSPEFIRSRKLRTDGVHCRESAGTGVSSRQGSSSNATGAAYRSSTEIPWTISLCSSHSFSHRLDYNIFLVLYSGHVYIVSSQCVKHTLKVSGVGL